ncbi:MAG TPA: carboxypeptidase regulatory-like domain-containing protein, partial [Blastocatellia bacterium]|nr:carboxypeptidase regulatory-like domain-containing protein [Blastocatellia bacterium]
KRIEIIYSHIINEKDGVYTFDYPLGQGYKKLRVPVGEVHINIDLGSDVAIKNVFSPTHPVDLNFDGDRRVTGRLVTAGGGGAENFKLVYALTDDEIGMSLLTHRKEGEDGYFLLMLSPKVEFDRERISAKDVVFVIDFSYSMEGDKIRQAKEALRFGLTRTLGENDRFNIIVFGGQIIPMEKRLIRATRANIARAIDFVGKQGLLSATNINDALVTAMGMFERGARPQNLVFITDGQPTASISDPNQIVANTRAANTANARLFTFGVGRDVNRLLLERLALENRGAESNIADESKLESTVSSFFAKVSQPVLSNLNIDFGQLHVDRLHPAQLPDLYTRTQIKIFGRYKNEEDLRDVLIALTGQMHEEVERFDFGGLNFPLVSKDKDFLPKLWATERVQALLAEIRLYGERPDLRQEVIDLAREFNLVTPYTSMYVPTTGELEQERASGAVQGKSFNLDGSDPQKNQTATADKQLGQLPLNGRQFEKLALLAELSTPGTVTDPSGAVIPGATVTIKDQSTGATRTVTTDAAGNYSVAGLPPGTYKIEVDAPGFNKTQVENVVIQPGQVSSTGVRLSPGAVTETVTVVAVASAIDSTTSHTSSNYESKKLRDLPSLAPVDSFARLAPGATSREANEVNRQTGGSDKNAEFRLWFNGGRARSNVFTFDGQDNNDIDGRPAISINNFDSVETLHVLTSRGAGDVGLTGASSINLITRAGTNEFHGTIFDYHLNRRLGALSPLERRSGLERAPEFKNTIYGGTFGGPIRRDRAFFFGSFQSETEDSGHFVDSTSSQLTPTQSGLEHLARLFPSSATVSDLIQRGPLAQLDGNPQTSRRFLLSVGGDPVEFGQLTRILRTSTEGYETGARFDFNLTRRDTLKAGYWFDSRSASNAVGRLASGYAGETDSRTHLGSLRWNRLLSPNSSNEFLFGVHRVRLALIPETVASNDSDEGLLSPSVLVGLRGLSYGHSPFATSSHSSTVFELSDALSKVAGRHNLKLGAQFKRRLADFDFMPGRSGQYTYA